MSSSKLAAQAERVKLHPALLDILSAVLQGKPLREVAEAFELPEAELVAYCAEAGLVPGSRTSAPESTPEPDILEREEPGREEAPQPRQPEAPCSEPVEAEDVEAAEAVDRSAEHERQMLQEATRRRGEPEGQRPEPSWSPLQEEQRRIQQQARERIEAARRSYESQPMPSIGACLAGDPLIPGFTLHVGFQPAERLAMLMLRERLERNDRLAEWRSNPFHWRQEPPEDWFD